MQCTYSVHGNERALKRKNKSVSMMSFPSPASHYAIPVFLLFVAPLACCQVTIGLSLQNTPPRCPGFHPLEMDGLRSFFVQSGITDFNKCYISLTRPSTPSLVAVLPSQARQLFEAVVQLTESALGALSDVRAHVVPTNQTANVSTDVNQHWSGDEDQDMTEKSTLTPSVEPGPAAAIAQQLASAEGNDSLVNLNSTVDDKTSTSYAYGVNNASLELRQALSMYKQMLSVGADKLNSSQSQVNLCNQGSQSTVNRTQMEMGFRALTHGLTAIVNATRTLASRSCRVLEDIAGNYDATSKTATASANKAEFTQPSFCSETGIQHLNQGLAQLTNSFTFDAFACQVNLSAHAIETFCKLNGAEEGLRKSFSIGEARPTGTPTLNFSVFHQGVLVVCYTLFPPVGVNGSAESNPDQMTCLDKERTRPQPAVLHLCENTCQRLKNVVATFVRFINLTKSPLMFLLYGQTQTLCPKQESQNSRCVDFHHNMTAFQRPSSQTPKELFCMNVSCHYPLRETSNPNHWLKSSQTQLRLFFDQSDLLFPSAALPFNGSKLPCGADCVSVVFSADVEEETRITRTVFGTIAVFTNVVAIVVFYVNRHKLQHIARRLNLYVNIAYVIGPGADTLFAAYPSVYKKVACYSDGTVRLHEPNLAEGSSVCVFFSFKFVLCTFAYLFFLVCMEREWYLMVSELHRQRGNRHQTLQNEKKRELTYIIVTLTLSTLLITISLARSKVEGSPSRGTCYVEIGDVFYLGVITFFIITIIMSVYLCLGLPKLHKIYRKASGFHNQRKFSDASGDKKQASSDVAIRSLESLMKLLLAYAVITLISLGLITPTYTYLFARDDGIKADIERHLTCMTSRCDQESCPPLPTVNKAVILITENYFALSAMVMSLWAFNWNAYWREHLPMANTDRQPRKISAVSTMSSQTSTSLSSNITEPGSAGMTLRSQTSSSCDLLKFQPKAPKRVSTCTTSIQDSAKA